MVCVGPELREEGEELRDSQREPRGLSQVETGAGGDHGALFPVRRTVICYLPGQVSGSLCPTQLVGEV